MKLYYTKGACSLAVRIVIHELNISCEYESVNLKTKQTETGQDFTKINPKGAVPVLMIDKDKILTENAVIQQYLADSQKANNLLPPVSDFKRYRVLEWLNYVSTELHKTLGALFNAELNSELKNNFFMPMIKKKFNYVEQQLGDKKYLMGDELTLPDTYLFVVLLWLAHFKIDITEWPKLAGYLKRIKERPAVQAALKEEGLPL